MSFREKTEPLLPHVERGSRITARPSDPSEELRLVAEVRSMEHPDDFVIGGQVDLEREEVVLVRGDFSQVVIPFAWFGPTRAGVQPDFQDFEILETGQTLRFGEYEAPVSIVLGQHDLRLLGGT